MIKNSVLALIVLVGQDDAKRAELVQQDLKRIAERTPVKDKVSRVADLPAWTPRQPFSKFHLQIVPVGFSDDAGEEMPAVAEKLLEYVKANSGGALDLKVSFAPRISLSEARAVVSKDRLGSAEEGAWVAKWMDRADLKEVDGVCLAYAGILEPGKNSMLWPHQTTLEHKGVTRRYYIAPQGGASAGSIHGHEFMHLFGLKDKYDAKSPHCILAYGYEPLRLCASCRAALGWAKVGLPSVNDGVRVRLANFAKTPECVRIDLVSGGSEYLILEHRDKLLLAWHTVDGSTKLCAQLDGVTADRLTPYSEPKFRAKSTGSRPVYITDLRIDEEGASFKVSANEPLTDLEQDNLSRVGRVLNPK